MQSSIVSADRVDSTLHEELPDALALRVELGDLGDERAECAVDIGVDLSVGARVGGESLGELAGDAVVVDDQPVRLLRCGAVDPGDRLEQFGFLDEPVEVQHLGVRVRRSR